MSKQLTQINSVVSFHKNDQFTNFYVSLHLKVKYYLLHVNSPNNYILGGKRFIEAIW